MFIERGYEATTIADIAEAADVSRATFFSYYASKDDVVFDLGSGDGRIVIEAASRHGARGVG